jgi:hypothetical protein
MDAETPDMASVWTTVDRELHRRRLTWLDLKKALSLSDQVLYNWKQRKAVPRARQPDVAAFLGWSVDQLLGLAPEPPRLPPVPVPAPEPVYTKRANDIARMFDDLKDDKVRQTAYSTVMNILQMAKAGQRLPEPPAPEPPPAPPKAPMRTIHPPAVEPKQKLQRGR